MSVNPIDCKVRNGTYDDALGTATQWIQHEQCEDCSVR